jgi:uncharacterized protein (TIGR00730 family)
MMAEEERIKSAFSEKDWNEIKTFDSWTVFKIIAEFVEGFEKMSKIGPCVSIFGSARTPAGSKYFNLAKDISFKLTQFGYGIITGGGPGVMEAANMGARKGGGRSVGLSIDLPHEQGSNKFIDSDKLITFSHFFVRKVIFVKYAQGFIVLPGGFGTFDEFFEALTLIQTKKIGKFPIILVGTNYWKGLIDWIKDVMMTEESNISPEDMELFSLVDTADEAVEKINLFYSKYLLSPNF